ncbi:MULTISPECIES: EAL and HDOD domain-containing protein [unclassified Legionella]|uniref:EAL and HDOD domain-containing protein n=1 Tax=unclassified Legionella TaxID=2622702 RepID=UPI001056B3A1|nr:MULTISPECIES: HDOD domain-containing protein [unclassified Legionella]MDI9819178.1 HDOD domain-containing protein [Legionella sp. PL877]
MLIKRSVYNQQLKCTGVEIIANKQAKAHEELFEHFATIQRNTATHLPLFIPYMLKFLVENPDAPIEHPVIIKLHAGDIDVLCPRTELENYAHPVALLISNPQQLAWLNFAEYIALTEHLMTAANVSKVVKYSQDRERKVIAYDISNTASFERCKAMKMDFYCGDFLFHPQGMTEKNDIASSQINLLELITTLQQDTSLETIINLIQADPMLSYQLLKVANAVAFSGYQDIESIQQAVVRLGILNLKNWVMALSMTNISNKPLEIVESGLIRAQMAQKLAETQPELCAQSAYTMGLLSVLDSLMDSPLEVLIEQITLSSEVKLALLSREGPLGKILDIVIAYEEGHWENLQEDTYLGLDLSQIYIDCLEQVSLGKQAIRKN